MDSVCLARKLTRPEEAVDPPQVFADCPLAGDSFLQTASRLSGGYVINKAILSKINTVLPESLFQFFAFEAKQRTLYRDLNCFGSTLALARHSFIST